MAKVIPIFKKDDPLDCVNYRPISLLPIFSKIFEKIIYSRMYEFLESNKLIYNRQFGFRANHSTNHALISMTESIKSFLDTGDFVAGIFIFIFIFIAIEGKVRSVIIRFVNRKNAELAIKRSYKLFTSSNNTFKRYFISDNLSPATRRIFNRLYKLKKKIINDVWTFNGQAFLKINDNVNERAILVGHFDDIDYYLDV